MGKLPNNGHNGQTAAYYEEYSNMVKNAEENVIEPNTVAHDPVAPLEVYASDVANWDEQDALKEYVVNNTVGLKTGHNNKARYYVVRAPQHIVVNAAINQHTSSDAELVTSIFTFYLYRSDKELQKKRYTIGVTSRIDGKRKFYSLTGGLRQVKTRLLADETRFKSVLHAAIQAAAQWGITDDTFSNQLGINRREYTRPTVDTGSNSAFFAGYDVEGEATDW